MMRPTRTNQVTGGDSHFHSTLDSFWAHRLLYQGGGRLGPIRARLPEAGRQTHQHGPHGLPRPAPVSPAGDGRTFGEYLAGKPRSSRHPLRVSCYCGQRREVRRHGPVGVEASGPRRLHVLQARGRAVGGAMSCNICGPWEGAKRPPWGQGHALFCPNCPQKPVERQTTKPVAPAVPSLKLYSPPSLPRTVPWDCPDCRVTGEFCISCGAILGQAEPPQRNAARLVASLLRKK